MAAHPRPERAPGDVTTASIHVLQRTPKFLRTRIVGHFDLRAAHALLAMLTEWSGDRTRLMAFHDCSELVDYDVEARDAITRWSRAHVGRFEAVHLLVANRPMAWVLQIIAAVMGGKLTVHHSRLSFESANARHLAR